MKNIFIKKITWQLLRKKILKKGLLFCYVVIDTETSLWDILGTDFCHIDLRNAIGQQTIRVDKIKKIKTKCNILYLYL